MAVDAKPIMLVARDFDLRSAHDILQAAISSNGTNVDTINLISSLVLAESKLVRTSTIILASFNTLAAFITASSILYDCYWASKRCSPKFKSSKFCVSSIHPAETFPLILAIAIFIQGLIFAGVQGRGLKTLYIDGCADISQIVWPAIFLVPYVQLVFGIECTLRSFRSLPFQARGKYDVTICLCAVVLMLIATWIPSHINPELDTCFASLLWFVSGFGNLGIVLLSSTAGLMLICALIIYYRLSAVNLIDQHQRIVASRIVHHMIVGAAFAIPFFISLSQNRGSTKLSMMATIMLNISGLLNGLLHLLLRSNTSTTSFGPKMEDSWDIRKHDIRIFGRNELALYNPLFDPVPGPATMSPHGTRYSNRSYQRGSMIASEIDMEKFSSIGYSETDTLIGKTLVRQNTSPVSYSLFPHRDLYQNDNRRAASIYDSRDLDLPLPTFIRNSRHTRNSSDSSIATVQIGLRLSQAPMENLLDSNSYRLPATTYNSRIGGDTSPTSPSSPLSPQQLKPNTYSDFQKAVLPPVPLILDTSTSDFSPSVSTPLKSSVFNPNIWGDASNGFLKSERSDSFSNKKYHSTLRVPSFVEKVRATSIRLSPDVYKPEKKLSIFGKISAEPKKTTLSRSDTHPPLKSPLAKVDWI